MFIESFDKIISIKNQQSIVKYDKDDPLTESFVVSASLLRMYVFQINFIVTKQYF